jgi:hypothetical protein
MKDILTDKGYEQTKAKLAQLEQRLTVLRARTDLHPSHHLAAERSYLDMIGQYKRDLKLYEAVHSQSAQ